MRSGGLKWAAILLAFAGTGFPLPLALAFQITTEIHLLTKSQSPQVDPSLIVRCENRTYAENLVSILPSPLASSPIAIVEAVASQPGSPDSEPLYAALAKAAGRLGANLVVDLDSISDPQTSRLLRVSQKAYAITLDGTVVGANEALGLLGQVLPTLVIVGCSSPEVAELPEVQVLEEVAKRARVVRSLISNRYTKELERIRRDSTKMLLGFDAPGVPETADLAHLTPLQRKNVQYVWGLQGSTGKAKEAISSAIPGELTDPVERFAYKVRGLPGRLDEILLPVMMPKIRALRKRNPTAWEDYKTAREGLGPEIWGSADSDLGALYLPLR